MRTRASCGKLPPGVSDKNIIVPLGAVNPGLCLTHGGRMGSVGVRGCPRDMQNLPSTGSSLRNLPDVAIWIDETGRSNSPRPIHRTIEQLNPSIDQPDAGFVDIVNHKGEHYSRSRSAGRRDSWRDQFGNRWLNEKIDKGVAELENGRLWVTKMHGEAKGCFVERSRSVEILDEQGDGGDARPISHV
jgi:hypothetical protein